MPNNLNDCPFCKIPCNMPHCPYTKPQSNMLDKIIKCIVLFLLLCSCDQLDFSKYVILTPQGRWICEKSHDGHTYSDCEHEVTKEKASTIYSGNSVVLEKKE